MRLLVHMRLSAGVIRGWRLLCTTMQVICGAYHN
jgi:hypothetical protein